MTSQVKTKAWNFISTGSVLAVGSEGEDGEGEGTVVL